jgi:manganese/zinc/iron transport system substrate-binding protein
MRTRLIILLSVLLLALSACVPSSTSGSEDLSGRTVRVLATTGMVGDVAKNVGGERVVVTTLMGAGVDPHLYKATESDLRKFEQADVIFYNGLHLEAGLSDLLERMGSQREAVAVTAGIERSQLLSDVEYEDAYDPHVWFDVTLWMKTVETVRETLSRIDPASAEIYQKNAENYLSELQDLHQYVAARASELPEEKRILITAHDAFGYFGKAYGFEVYGLQGISTESEASVSDVQELAEFIFISQVPAVFIESSVPQRNVEALQAAVKAKGFDVKIGGELFSDAMGEPGTVEGTYIGMVRHNIDTIVSALKGD